MPRILTVAATILAALLAVAPVSAQGLDFQPVDLTLDRASRALDAFPDVHAVAQRYEDQFPDGETVDNLADLGTLAAAKAELDGAVAGYGFGTYEDWIGIVMTIFHTYAHVESGGALQAMGPALEQALDQIRNNPSIPEDQKEMLMQQLAASSGALASFAETAPSPENQAVVRELGPRIEAISEQVGR